MQEAEVKGSLVKAGPNSPAAAVCPACGGIVEKRKRRRMDGQVTYFYRHKPGEGKGCPRRYHLL